MSRVQVKEGTTCFLWQDLWGDQVLEQAVPELFSFARKTKISVSPACQSAELYDLFYLPLSVEAFHQFQEFTEIISNVQLHDSPGCMDICLEFKHFLHAKSICSSYWYKASAPSLFLALEELQSEQAESFLLASHE